MSRIGKRPVVIPQGVKASVNGGLVLVEGPLGKLQFQPGPGIVVAIDSGHVLVKVEAESKQTQADYGTARATINNMVNGVSKGWKRSLELSGVGYTAKLQGQKLVLAVGFSHEVEFDVPKTIKCVVNKNAIELESCDRELLGTFASRIRKTQPPEPYLGKGIKYSEEVIRRKAGKAGKK